MRLVLVYLIILLMTSGFAKEDEVMKSLNFPKECKFESVNVKDKKDTIAFICNAKAAEEKGLKLDVEDQLLVEGKKIKLKATLINSATINLVILAMPYGGEAPYGGTSPFRVSLAKEDEKKITYIGKTYPPKPPAPMKIVIPAKSNVIFMAEFSLEDYLYPKDVDLCFDWAFHYYEEPYVTGKQCVKLTKSQTRWDVFLKRLNIRK